MNAALNDNIRIFTGNSIPELAHKICDHLSLPLGQAMVSTFSDGEIRVEIADNVRGRDVFLIQSTCPPTNHNLMELLLMIDAVKRASARRITAVIPYFGYARQDRKVAPRVPITAKLVADLLVYRRGPTHSHHGPARGADSGLFQYSGGQSLRFPRHDSLYPGEFSGRPGHRVAGRRGCPGPGLTPSA